MSDVLQEVRQSLAFGKCVLCVLSDDAFGMSQSFTEADPVESAAGRCVFYWDSEDGLSTPSGVVEGQGLTDAILALQHVQKNTQEGLFVFNLDNAGIAEVKDAFRRALKALAPRMTPAAKRAMVLVSSEPLPESIAKLFTKIGYPSEAAAKAAPTAKGPGGPWREARQLDTFDTDAWRDRLEGLASQDLQEIINSDSHAESVHRVRDLRDGMKRLFAHKDELIDLLVYATVAQVPLVLLGPPGTAKSNLVRCMCEGMGLAQGKGDAAKAAQETDGDGQPRRKLFEYLLTRYTTPEEIFGPVHIPDLISKRTYRRVTSGRLPEAEVAFLDEIFKASSAIVNTLLAILNERIFHNAEVIQRVPLIMVFAASNEPPQDPQLAALYDRFPLRANCGRVTDDHVRDLWERSWELHYDKTFSTTNLSMPRTACTNDFRLLHRVALGQFGGRALASGGSSSAFDFNAEFLRIFRSMRRDYDLSDRTLRALYALARAMAVVEGRTHLSVEELNVFRYVSWDESGTGDLDRLVSNLKRGVSM